LVQLDETQLVEVASNHTVDEVALKIHNLGILLALLGLVVPAAVMHVAPR
jgi:hypothetical protein